MILECEIFDSTYRTANTAPLSHSFVSKLKGHPSNLLDSIFKQTVLVKANQKCCITISVKQNAHFLSGNKPSIWCMVRYKLKHPNYYRFLFTHLVFFLRECFAVCTLSWNSIQVFCSSRDQRRFSSWLHFLSL